VVGVLVLRTVKRTTPKQKSKEKIRRLLLLVLASSCWLGILSASDVVDSPDLARRFGVAESLLSSKSKSWKVECNSDSTDFFDRFRDYDEIIQHLTTLHEANPETTRLVEIGKSFENRPIYSFELISNPNAPVILALAGIHGREWTSIAALVFALTELVDSPLKNVQLNIVPVVNPDGLMKTFSSGTHTKEKYSKGEISTEEDIPNRYFRKNANGVDLNRNFNVNWGNDTKTKSLKLKNSDVYQGTKAFSEKETLALQRYVNKFKPRFVSMIDFHCCIGAVLGPPMGIRSQEDWEENERVGQLIVQALSLGGKGVTRTVKNGDGVPGQYEWRTREAKDRGAGISSSWGFSHVLLTFVVELRGKFVAPCFEIKQLGKEALFAMRALIKHVEANGKATLLRQQQQQQRKPQRIQTSMFLKSTWLVIWLSGVCVLVFLWLVKTHKLKV
jgi:hypothetical protein